MQWLNYHHFLYFWLVVREGGVVPASRVLKLSHPTVSGQIRQLEASLGEQLFDRSKRHLELTEVGKLAYRYADEIFQLGQEFLDTLKGRSSERPLRLMVGVTDGMPKLIVRRLLEPALSLPMRVRMTVEEDQHDRVLAELALHNLDVVLTDAPLQAGSPIRAFNHVLGECGVSFFAAPTLHEKLEGGFPQCLERAPFLMPTSASTLRRSLEQWFDGLGVRPEIVAEFEDSALLNVFGQDGYGVFCAHSVIEQAVLEQHGARLLGRTTEIVERFYAISMERKLKHPAVLAIRSSARGEMFTG